MSTQDPNPSSPDPYGTPQAPRYDQGQQYGQPAPGQQGGYPAAPAYSGEQGVQGGSPKNGLGLAALIVGIVALLLSLIPVVGFLGLVALVLGIIGLRRVKAGTATNRGMAIAGIVLGVLSTLVAIGVLVLGAVLFSSVSDCTDLVEDQVAYEQCVTDQLS